MATPPSDLGQYPTGSRGGSITGAWDIDDATFAALRLAPPSPSSQPGQPFPRGCVREGGDTTQRAAACCFAASGCTDTRPRARARTINTHVCAITRAPRARAPLCVHAGLAPSRKMEAGF